MVYCTLQALSKYLQTDSHTQTLEQSPFCSKVHFALIIQFDTLESNPLSLSLIAVCAKKLLSIHLTQVFFGLVLEILIFSPPKLSLKYAGKRRKVSSKAPPIDDSYMKCARLGQVNHRLCFGIIFWNIHERS